jgi:MFS family permease
VRQALAPLRLPGFRHLVFAYTVNELGNWLGEIALAVLVFDQTGSPLATAALFIGMQFVPAIVGQGLVARLEVVGSKVGLPVIYAAEGATFAVLAALADNFVLALVIALAALDGVLALSGRALARAASAAVLAPSGALREGNALLNVGFTAAGALGPLTAGLLVAGVGARAALILDAVSFLLVALALVSARSLPNVKAEANPWRERLREGLAYVARQPILRRLIGAQAAAFVFFAAVIPIEIVYAKDTLGAGDSGYGVLLAAWGTGMVLGSFVFAAARRLSLALLLLVSTVTIGAAYLAMSAAPTLAVACVAGALGGVGNGVQWVSVMSAIQGLTSADYQARVVGLLESSGFAMPGVGFLLGGVLAYLFDPRVSFLIAGAGVLAVVAFSAPLLRRTDWPSELEEPAGVNEALAAEVDAPVTVQGVRPETASDAVES